MKVRNTKAPDAPRKKRELVRNFGKKERNCWRRASLFLREKIMERDEGTDRKKKKKIIHGKNKRLLGGDNTSGHRLGVQGGLPGRPCAVSWGKRFPKAFANSVSVGTTRTQTDLYQG